VLSKDVTWGEMKSTHREIFGTGTSLSTDHLTDKNLLKSGYFKHDDEFYYSLNPEAVQKARLQHWPRTERPEDHEEFFVTMDDTGTVLLVLVLVNDERFYYRNNGNWIYIGPGDDVFGFEGHELTAVTKQVVSFFDYTESREFDLVEESISSIKIS
jgi:hypothetical protein